MKNNKHNENIVNLGLLKLQDIFLYVFQALQSCLCSLQGIEGEADFRLAISLPQFCGDGHPKVVGIGSFL